MTVNRVLISISALVAVFAATSPMATAQGRLASASMAKPASASVWQCAASRVEIAPVSYDTSGEAETWVLVHRVKGEIIAAERVSKQEVEQIRRLPCQGDAALRPPPLVG